MSGKSFFSKLAGALLDREGKTPEDIDREIESEVQAIKQQRGETLKGEALLLEKWKSAGDLVYILDLVPIYDAIGGREGHLGQRMAEVCENIFGHHVAPGDGHAYAEGDLFFMRFREPDDAAGFRNAAIIINDIGTQMMGERFKTIDIPGLVAVAKLTDISDDNGRLSLGRAKAEVNRGGIGFVMDEPRPDDPHWFKACRRNLRPVAKQGDPVWSELHRRKPSDPDWVGQRSSRRRLEVIDPSRTEQRSGAPRRAIDHPTEVDW